MREIPGFFQKRESFSGQRLADLGDRVSRVTELEKVPNLSVYVSGSYGRLEASTRSDLDLFFVHEDTKEKASMSKLTKTIIDAELIKITRELHFPEFSDEGVYLEVHSLGNMLEALGGREDDYRNYFTARLLLLLESRPLCHRDAYNRVVEQIVKAYFRDYHDHERDFRPVFLINDVLRFWKTLCLNYEHKRNRPARDEERKRKSHLRNLKLKFSRLMTCFSMVVSLSSTRPTTPDEVVTLVGYPPIRRLTEAVGSDTKGQEVLKRVLDEYEWFLEMTARNDVLDWIGVKEQRSGAFDRARRYASDMYELLIQSSEPGSLRYLVI